MSVMQQEFVDVNHGYMPPHFKRASCINLVLQSPHDRVSVVVVAVHEGRGSYRLLKISRFNTLM